MKKLKFIFIVLLIVLLPGCSLSDPKYPHLENKASVDFYTKEMYAKILSDDDFSIRLFDTNYYKYINVPDVENSILENFIHSLSNESYENVDIPEDKEPYQLRVEFKDGTKYVIKVFNDEMCTLNPWDGNFEEDVISMESVPIHYNLYDFCKYIENQSKALKD